MLNLTRVISFVMNDSHVHTHRQNHRHAHSLGGDTDVIKLLEGFGEIN